MHIMLFISDFPLTFHFRHFSLFLAQNIFFLYFFFEKSVLLRVNLYEKKSCGVCLSVTSLMHTENLIKLKLSTSFSLANFPLHIHKQEIDVITIIERRNNFDAIMALYSSSL